MAANCPDTELMDEVEAKNLTMQRGAKYINTIKAFGTP